MLGIARPTDIEKQHAAYEKHKRKHGFKFQTITLPESLILPAHGPMAGSKQTGLFSLKAI